MAASVLKKEKEKESIKLESGSEWRRVFKKGKNERINQTGEGERVVAGVLK